MLRSSYNRVVALSASRYAPLWLAAVSFAESSFLPVPPDLLLIPMALARPDRAFRLALLCTLASVLGGMFGYYIGYALWDLVAGPLIHFYHYENAAQAYIQKFREYGLWLILIKGLTPIPYKLVTITSGMAHFNFSLFVLGSVITRGSRFFVLAALLRYSGAPVRDMIESRLTLVTTLIVVSIVFGFFLMRYI